MNVIPCARVVVSARCVTVAAPSTVKRRPFSHAMIILLPNVPTLSNVSELWSELGQPPNTPDQSANGMKILRGGVVFKTCWFRVTKRSPGVNPAAADSAGAIAMYFSTNPVLTIVEKNEPFPRQSTVSICPFWYWLTKN